MKNVRQIEENTVKKNKEKLNRQARARGNQYQEQVTW